MTEQLLLIDFENVGEIDMSRVPAGMHVRLFVGASQQSVPIALLTSALKLGKHFELIKIGGQGKNALDFHIAFYLGEMLARWPRANCIVLSKDKGFDPLVAHLTARAFLVQRVTTLEQRFAPVRSVTASSKAADTPKESALQWLTGMPEAKRPRKRKGLITHLHNYFGKKMSVDEVVRLVDALIAGEKLSEVEGKMTYRF